MRRLLSLPILSLLVTTSAFAGKKDPEKKPEEGIKALKEVTKKCRRYPGLFTLYQDTVSGATYILVRRDQLDKDHLYFSQAVDGPVDANFFRGAYAGEMIFRFARHFDRVELRQQNTAFAFDPASPLARASQANINVPVLWSEKIDAADKKQDSLLVKADGLFLTEALMQLKFPAPPMMPAGSWFDVGSLDKDRTKVVSIHAYPRNTDVVTEYVFTNPYPQNWGGQEMGDPRSTSIRLRHSLIELPTEPFRPRLDDPRVGYFTHQVNDMTTTDAINYRDVIHRWKLEKKDPAASISEPVSPITWWIENTTPKELRPAIKEGVEAWNLAFEKCGFRNALVVKEQPDTASWDAGDLRYNVLRWTSSPSPPFGGYGPSFADPRTGQILGADVMLEFIFVTNRMREAELFQSAGMGYMAMSEEQLNRSTTRCLFAADLHDEVLAGTHMLDAMGLGEAEKSRFINEALRDLTLHEVGHTLGLNHNMKASSIHTPDQLKDRAFTEAHGITGSVMDYAPSNVASMGDAPVQYFETKPCPYDDWAIAYGYTQVTDPDVENITLKEILARSTEPQLLFGNDADDMRSPGHGIDPRTMIFDQSSDPVEYAERTIALSDRTLTGLLQRYGTGDRSYQELLFAYLTLTGRKFTAANTMTRQIGGIYLDRSFTSQGAATKPFTPVPYDTQKRAMKALAKHAFAPDAFQAGADLYAFLQWQRRGFDHFGRNEDPRIHDRVLFAQIAMLEHLLHRNTLRRLVDSEQYGNTYRIGEMMSDLTNACFDADKAGTVNTFRQNLQQACTDKLIGVVPGNGYTQHACSMAQFELDRIRKGLNLSVTDKGTLAHRAALKLKIDRALAVDR